MAAPRIANPVAQSCLFALSAGLLAAAIFAVVAAKNSEYLARFVPFGDVSSYYSNQIQSYLRILDHGAWREIEWQLRGNIRDPLRGIFAASLNPDWLVSVNGYLVFSACCHALFIFLLTIYARRKGSAWWQVICAVGFTVIGRYAFDPVRGVGAIYPDVPASFMFGSAVVALLLGEGRRKGWMFVFGLLSVLTAMSRAVAGGYLLWLTAPVLLWYLIGADSWRTRREILVAMALAAVPVIAALPWVIHITGLLLPFYTQAGYALGNVWPLVAITFERALAWRIGYFGALVAVLAVAAAAIDRRAIGRASIASMAISGWLLIGHLLLIGLVLRVGDDWTALAYFVPLCCIVIAVPFVGTGEPAALQPRRWLRAFQVAVVLMVIAGVSRAVFVPVRSNSDPRYEEFFQAHMAHLGKPLRELASGGRRPTIEMSYWEYSRFVIVGALRREGVLLEWTKFLQVHKDQWEMIFGGRPHDEVAALLHDSLLKRTDLYVTLADKNAERAKPLFVSDLTVQYISRIDVLVSNTPMTWRKCLSFDSPFGTVAAYVNASRVARADVERACSR
jgi:hypothetical protein